MPSSPDELLRDFVDAFLKQDADAIADLYAEDAVYVLAAAGIVAEGREAIRQAYRAIFSSGDRATAFSIETRPVSVSGDVAYSHMTATVEVDRGGASQQVGLRVTEVMRRGADGQWRYVIDHA